MATAIRNAKRRSALGNVAADTAQAVAIYARVSTEDQAERATIQSQLDFLRRFVDLHEPARRRRVRRRRHQRHGAARRSTRRATPPDRRRGRPIRRGPGLPPRSPGTLAARALDAHDALDRHGVAIRSGTEPFDTSSPIGSFLFQLLASLAELEKSTISGAHEPAGATGSPATGSYTGGPIPLGYDLDAEKRFIASERIVEQLGVTEARHGARDLQRVASGQSTALAEAIG